MQIPLPPRPGSGPQKRNAPLETLQDLIEQSQDRKALRQRFNCPHPLSKFAVNGEVRDCAQADMIIDSIEVEAFEKPFSIRWLSARWFLLQSTMLFDACQIAGIDGRKLRRHLRRVMRVLDHQRMNTAAGREIIPKQPPTGRTGSSPR